VRGLVVGVLGLTAFYNVVTLAPSAQGGLTTLANMPGKIAQWLISPSVPLIPQRATATAPATGSWAGGNGSPAANGGSWGGAAAGPGLGGAWPTSVQTPLGSSGVQAVLAGANQATAPIQFA